MARETVRTNVVFSGSNTVSPSTRRTFKAVIRSGDNLTGLLKIVFLCVTSGSNDQHLMHEFSAGGIVALKAQLLRPIWGAYKTPNRSIVPARYWEIQSTLDLRHRFEC